ncbi:MAG: PKD domain-containing protein [Bacteroidota bacterium]
MKKHCLLAFLLLLLFFASSIESTAQHKCGTVLETDADLEELRLLDEQWRAQKHQFQRAGRSISFVPIQLHIIRDDDGNDGLSAEEFIAALKIVNDHFKAANIHFYQCSGINYIDDTDYYNYDKSEMWDLDRDHGVPNVVNIYTTRNVLSGTTSICGHAQFPGGLDFVMLANSCTNNGSTFAHELGHYFDLYHTHTTAFGPEAVDGSDCATQGDMLCDTPADPRLSGLLDPGCAYNGTDTDENGDQYEPEPTNVMSYARKECRTYFTPGQLSRMAFALTNSRAYLNCGNAIDLNADFYVEYDPDCVSQLSVDFSDATEAEATAWNWNFGDGNSSTLQSPSHTYTAPGVYDVDLTVTKDGVNDQLVKTKAVKVGVKNLPVLIDFEGAPTALDDFWVRENYKGNVGVDATAAKDGNGGLYMDGYFNSTSPRFNTPTTANAFDSLRNQFYKSKVELCIDARPAADLLLEFDLRQLYFANGNYSNLRILVDGQQVGGNYQVASDAAETWQRISVDLTAVAANRVFTLAFEGSHKYTKDYRSTDGTATFIDNISVTTTSPLPVELVDFSARAASKEQAVLLNWETASEINNDYFEIEKSRDGMEWFVIERQKGKGNTNQPTYYRAKDLKPFSGQNYYRLRQVDFNGAANLSDIRVVEFGSLAGTFELFPNPATKEVQVRYEKDIQSVGLFDLTGKQIERNHRLLSDGLMIDLEALPAGVYWVRVNQELPQKLFVR